MMKSTEDMNENWQTSILCPAVLNLLGGLVRISIFETVQGTYVVHIKGAQIVNVDAEFDMLADAQRAGLEAFHALVKAVQSEP